MVTMKLACTLCVAVHTFKVISWVAPTGGDDPVSKVKCHSRGEAPSPIVPHLQVQL